MPVIEPTPPLPKETPEIQVYQHSPFSQYNWYYLDENRQPTGPIDFVDLEMLWEERKLNEHSLVWNDTMEDWKKVNEIKDLKEVLSKNASTT